jgi:hypothetical protein
LFGRHAKLWASEVSAKADRVGRSESPSFVMVNNTAAELKTTRESASRRRGITRGLVAYLMKMTELRANLAKEFFHEICASPGNIAA